MNTIPISDSTRQALAAHVRARLLGCNDRMPRVTTVYALDTEAEILKLAAWMNRYPEPLAARAARVYGGVKLVELGVA